MCGTPPDAEAGEDNATQSILRHGPKGDVSGLLAPSDVPGSLGRLGHCEVQQVVGSGGFGTVLRAFDGKLQRMVAVKRLIGSTQTLIAGPERHLGCFPSAASCTMQGETIAPMLNKDKKWRASRYFIK